MNVLFIVSGNSKNFEIAPFIKSQGDSLEKIGINISYFKIIGKGIRGYIKSSILLRGYLKNEIFDLIHAHYSLCGWVAVLARPGVPIVLSLMGSDALGEYDDKRKVLFKSRFIVLLTLLIQPFVSAIISKAKNINRIVYRKHIASVIPNGVNLNNPSDSRNIERELLNSSEDKIQILFLSDPSNPVKNFKLSKKAVEFINDYNIELCTPYPIDRNQVYDYLLAADLLISTSFMEGSPNLIKEAMACNCPIVSTDVGDVKWVFGDTEGCYLTSFDPQDVARKIKMAIAFSKEKGRTKGRERILMLGLNSETVAQNILSLYQKVLKKWR